jgi:hypothetical protein
MKGGLFDFHHPFFDPLWVRVLTVCVCMGWGLYEFATGAVFWAVIFCGVAIVAGYSFFIAREK